jgi:SAM-dependent methyltransferase
MELHKWHDRFIVQAHWTEQARQYLIAKIPDNRRSSILEIGSGTGAVLKSVGEYDPESQLYGLDINFRFLVHSQQTNSNVKHTLANGLALPYKKDFFSLVYFHYLLLWINDPLNAIQEAARVTAPGGSVAAFAEPDYLYRIDHPPELRKLGNLQSNALIAQGARIDIGSQLPGLFLKAGLINVEWGILGSHSSPSSPGIDLNSEWEMIKHDLGSTVNSEDLDKWEKIDREAWLSGNRVLYIPTFYAIGHKPE